MEDEMTTIEAEIQKWEARDKTSEYIEQMQEVEDKMNSEYKKIKTEMENVIEAKDRQAKVHKQKLENIQKGGENKIEEQKKQHEEKVKKIKNQEKMKKENEKNNKIIKKINDEAKDKTEKENNQNEERLKKLHDKAKELNEEICEAQKLKSEAHDVKEILETLKLLMENDKEEIVKEVTEKGIISKIKEKAQDFRRKRRRKWDEYYMKIACLAALRSKDPRRPVGACIAKWPTAKSDSNSYRIAGIGYNSMPHVEGEDNDTLFPWKRRPDPTPQESTRTNTTHKDPKTDPTLKHAYVVHAAVNAVLNKTRESIEGCTIYLTHFPDNDCAHAIIEAEIREVVYLKWKSRSEKDYDKVKELLDKNSVELRKLPREDIKEEKDLEVVTELEYRIDNESVDADEAAKTMAISWEQFFMGIAELSKVGACIVSPSKQVMAVGYSGYPENMEEINDDTFQGYYVSHAEYKAIIKTPSVKGCTLYVTKEPCCVCAKMIVQAGISKVIYKNKGTGNEYRASEKTLPTCLQIRKTEVTIVWNRSTERIANSQAPVEGDCPKK